MEPPAIIGVCGAGTMGAGIAQLAAMSGARTLVHDPVAGAAQRGVERARDGIARFAAKGRADAAAADRLEAVDGPDALAPCALILEAIPEDLALKQALFGELSRVAPDAVLATNTSSIPVTAVAAGAADPSRVVGLHFFNPPPLMALVELVAGVQSSPEALALTRAAAEAMGRTVIDAADGPGFVVNRCGRPFGLEAVRLLQERIADVPTIDRIVRAAGFPMGPFELEDLVGLDISRAAAESFFAGSYGEPRWRPSPLVAQLAAAGRLGRKTGHGWYRYEDGVPHREPDPDPPAAGGGAGRIVVISGWLGIAEELRERADDAGFAVTEDQPADAVPWLIVDCGAEPGAEPLQGAPRVLLCAEGALHALDPGGNAAGFHAIPPAGLVELTRTPNTAPVAAERAAAFFAALGLPTVAVEDAPGLVLGRIVAQLVNEAAFALGEGTGSAKDIDTGMTLGLNHPRGPLAWGDLMGLDHVVMVLDGLREEYGEERYRAAPLLRRIPAFHEHEHTGEPD